jgi:branched-chain amino acid aminotransferase
VSTMGGTVWLDGEFVDETEGQVSLLAHSLHYGLGVFEGIRCYRLHDGQLAIFRLRDHLRRLFDSAKVCQMTIPYSEDDLTTACIEIVRRGGRKPLYLRPLVFVGTGSMGISALQNAIHTCIVAWDFGTYLGEEGLRNGVRVQVSTFARGAVNSAMAKAKITGQYSTMVLAKQEAERLGFEETILLDQQGFVAEASAQNIFAVRDGTLWTVPLTAAIIAGFTRDSVVHIAHDLGIEVREERFTRDFLGIADEVFLTSTASEVMPVREIDGRPVGQARPGPITLKLQARFFDVVQGKNPRYGSWLTVV